MKVTVTIDTVVRRMKAATAPNAIFARASVILCQVFLATNPTGRGVAAASRHMPKLKAVRTKRGRTDRVIGFQLADLVAKFQAADPNRVQSMLTDERDDHRRLKFGLPVHILPRPLFQCSEPSRGLAKVKLRVVRFELVMEFLRRGKERNTMKNEFAPTRLAINS